MQCAQNKTISLDAWAIGVLRRRTMARLCRFGLILLTFFVALVIAGRKVPETFSLADDPSNDGDVIVQAIEIEATLAKGSTQVHTPFSSVHNGISRTCSLQWTGHSVRVAPLRNHGATLLRLLKLRRI